MTPNRKKKNTEENVHAKDNQEGSGDEAQVSKNLENVVRSSLSTQDYIRENLRVEM
jgi:hypothetical protein